MPQTLPPRDQVPAEQTWDLASVYPSDAAWAAAYAGAVAALPVLVEYRGRLGESGTGLLAALEARDRAQVPVGRLRQYASMQVKTDQGDVAAAGRLQQVQSLAGQTATALAYFEPELLALPPDQVRTLLAAEPGLAAYAHYLDDLQRRRAHIPPAAVQEVVAAAAPLTGAPASIYHTLTNAEIPFAGVPGPAGELLPLAPSNAYALVRSARRADRQAAWEAYADGYLHVQQTLAEVLTASFNGNIFLARAQGYPTALDAALDLYALPRTVYDSLIATCRRQLPLWHRYWAIRGRALGLSPLQGYDLDVPLVRHERRIPYATARDLISAGLGALGPEYGAVLRRGLFEERWVDWAANQGKRGGAESGGSYGTRPFLLLSYGERLIDVSALAHELGHSVHSYFTWESQLPLYQNYADFVGETASNLNQALVRAHLLATDADPAFQLEVLAEALAYFHRYFFLMPILAQFELACHTRLEAGASLTAATMAELMVTLFAEGYGPAVAIDAPRVGITWAQFPHLFHNFYVYQYSLGLAAATAIAAAILEEGAAAAARYLQCLRAGDAVYPLDALRLAGVDLTTPAPIERAFTLLEGLMDRLDALVGPGPLA